LFHVGLTSDEQDLGDLLVLVVLAQAGDQVGAEVVGVGESSDRPGRAGRSRPG